jgi:hypothetical protein
MGKTRKNKNSMIPKFKYIRSLALMRLYRLIPCQRCGADDGTISGAHSNQSIHGKGRAIKASDQFVASLCAACHSVIDFGPGTREDKKREWDKAHERTVKTLTAIYGKEYTDLING